MIKSLKDSSQDTENILNLIISETESNPKLKRNHTLLPTRCKRSLKPRLVSPHLQKLF